MQICSSCYCGRSQQPQTFHSESHLQPWVSGTQISPWVSGTHLWLPLFSSLQVGPQADAPAALLPQAQVRPSVLHWSDMTNVTEGMEEHNIAHGLVRDFCVLLLEDVTITLSS